MANRYINENLFISTNPLLDPDFLDRLFHERIRFTYAKVISLDMNENPIESIEGTITQGTINVDGDSSMRRAMTLNMVVAELNIHEYYWGLKTKIEVYAGLQNNIEPNYPNIIWFKQGTFVISSFNTTQGLGSYTVNIQGKDKMALLNGEMGGSLTALTYDFGVAKVTTASGAITKERLLLKDIIRSAVLTYAQVPAHKILISDLDDAGLELMEYRGSKPLYLIVNANATDYNTTLNGDMVFYTEDGESITVSEIEYYNPLFDLEQTGYTTPITYVYDSPNVSSRQKYSIAKLEYGMTAGYRLTDLVFAGDLILNVGDPITALFDKIIEMLGNYEYFFDLDGNFIFQKKRVYLQTHWTSLQTNDEQEIWANPEAFTSDITYSFEDAQLISNYANNPNLLNVRNDYSIWGTRKGAGGLELPVHLRYAIDIKPIEYVNYDGIKFTTRTMSDQERYEEILNMTKLSMDELRERAISQISSTNEIAIKINAILTRSRNNLNGLPDDWWDIRDWADAWESIVGYIPDGLMREYCHNIDDPTFNVKNYFDGGSLYWPSLIHVHADGRIASLQHSYSCGHPYRQWYKSLMGLPFDESDKPFDYSIADVGDFVYLYDPVWPPELATVIKMLVGSNFEEKQEELIQKQIYSLLYPSLDWREIIYQMALDYHNHHNEDSFHVTVAKNNPDLYPTGITGYEQYYTDLLEFWRQLYNPFYEYNYEPAGVTQKQYQNKVTEWYNKVLNHISMHTYEFPYYYEAPSYIQVTSNDTYHADMTYFKFSISNIDRWQEIDLTREEFYELVTPTAQDINLYYISLTDTKVESCLIKELFESSNLWFKTQYHNASNITGNGIAPNLLPVLLFQQKPNQQYEGTDYSADLSSYENTGVIPIEYLKLHDCYATPCFKAKSLKHTTYYYLNDQGEEVSIPGAKIDKEDYYNNPMKYWRYTGEYEQCTSESVYSSNIQYYYQDLSDDEEVAYLPARMLTQDIFNRDKERYYICVNDRVKVYSYVANIPENISNALYLTTNASHIDNLNTITMADTLYTIGTQTSFNSNKIAYSFSLSGETFYYFYNQEILTEETIRNYFTEAIENFIAQNKKVWAVYGEFVPMIHPIDYDPSIHYYARKTGEYNEYGWAPYVYTDPNMLNFWFDFLDQQGDLNKFSNKAIGNRPKAVNDNTVKSIYFRETPTIIFVDSTTQASRTKSGYTYIQLNDTNVLSLFALSAQGKSAKTVLDQYLYDFTCCAENINFTTIPYYNLDVNRRIFVSCPESNISGEYILNRFSMPLGPQGTMSITATKAYDVLY